MDVFDLRERLVQDYADYTRSFINVRDERIDALVDRELAEGLLWPDPIVQLNPAFEPGRPSTSSSTKASFAPNARNSSGATRQRKTR